MATAEELLNSVLKNEASVLSATDAVFVIDGESRTINVPDSERLFGVEGDKDVERKYFQCPKIVGDNIDLSQHQIYVSYAFTTTENSTSFSDADGLYHCEDVEVSGDNITFSWLLSGNVFANPGFIAFKVMAKKSEGEELKTKWNTAPAIGSVLLTVPDGEEIAEEYPDIINQLLTKMESVEQIATPEAMQGYVNAYLEENPVTGGMTAEQEQQLNQNTTDVAGLKSANDGFAIKIFNLASSVENVFKNVVFKSANTESFDYLSSLVQQLKPEGMVSVKYNLTNCTISTSVAYVMKGSTFTATISPDKNTEFQSLTVNVGGVDVTGTVVTDKTINISNVTGDIVITAIAKSLFWADGYKVLDYVYSSGNGDAYINTDWIMTDLKEKIVIGVQLSETNPTNSVGAFLGVNADSAFSSIYTAIELAQQNVDKISVGWGSYQPTSDSFAARYNEDLKSKIHYVSLTNGEQKLWEDEDMNVLYTGPFAANTQKYTMDDSRIPPFPVWLFRSNIQDVAYQSAVKKTYRSPGVKISCFKVYDGDGILTVNMRAAKRSNDGVVGFYDTVRKRFFENACDTGDLIGG